MLEVPVLDESGKQIGAEQIDEAALGGRINPSLLKQAVVRYNANRRQGDSVQKTRAEVAGSTRKLYRQKGTGNARAGNLRTPVRRGGGRAFPKKNNNYAQRMPRKMRRLARDNAVLAKITGGEAVIVDGLRFDEPKTKRFAAMLKSVGVTRSCTFATKGLDANLHKSGRNLQRMHITDVAELNAADILNRRRLVFTREAFAAYRDGLAGERAGDRSGDRSPTGLSASAGKGE